jgi:hypothetical protein
VSIAIEDDAPRRRRTLVDRGKVSGAGGGHANSVADRPN